MLTSFILGVLSALTSGVLLYYIRQRRRADRIRIAIATEIRKTTPVGSHGASRMGEKSLETPVINSNLDKLHLLSKKEIEKVANYHRHMSRIRKYSERESEEGYVKISPELAETGSTIATDTIDCLEKNIFSI